MDEETRPLYYVGAHGELAGALAKAQAAFPPITRDREVTVTSRRTGATYKFRYAPLDTIFSAVRAPLSENGLAIVQLLDGADLVTMLMHESGVSIHGRVPLPRVEGESVQEYGSAVTYLRRYALQAILGIASEEDDDGNAAAGNRATARPAARREPLEATDDGLIGVASTGKGDADFELRQGPSGAVLVFRLVDGRRGIKTVAVGPLAEQIAAHRAEIEGQTVTVWGSVSVETFTPKGGDKVVEYRVLHASRLTVGALVLPTADVPTMVDLGDTPLRCGDEDDSPMALGLCELPALHPGAHRSGEGTWPR